jgi:hypothetical protein
LFTRRTGIVSDDVFAGSSVRIMSRTMDID